MAGFGHAPSTGSARENPAIAARNARYGLWLFLVYFAVYAAFVGLNAFSPDVMATTIAGVNLAVVYGMVLIVAALVLALVYCWLCRGGTAMIAGSEAAREEGGR
jgi:uncharacterized membrane protein (DUF485 family)